MTAQLEELRERIVRRGEGRIRTELRDGIAIGVVRGSTKPTATMTRPSMTLVAGGRKRTAVGDVDFVSGPGQYVVASLDLPVIGHVSHASPDDPFAVLGLRLDPPVIAGLLADTVDVATPPAFTGMAVSDASPEVLDAAVRLLRAFDDPADAAALAPALERELVWRLLMGPQGGIVRQLGVPDSAVDRVARAVRWMREHLAEPIAVADLARMSGMSVSSFHRRFRAATLMTPLQWQKALRLREARTLLLAGGTGVAEAGYAVGYGNASQFSREYRRAFGAPPGQDVGGLRDGFGDDEAAASR